MIGTKYLFFGLILLAVLLEVVGDILIKKWSLESRNIFLMSCILIYLAGSAFWILSLKYEYLSRAISIFTVLNLILIVLAGVILFKENLSIANKLGIGLGILSVILLEL